MLSCRLCFPLSFRRRSRPFPQPQRRLRAMLELYRRPSPLSARDPGDAVIETDIAARLDRLPWDRFHTLVVVALGLTWILDGLEVTLAGALAGALKASPVLRF